MGCGQSKIGIYQRKSKSKKNGNKRTGGTSTDIQASNSVLPGGTTTGVLEEQLREGGESDEETEEAEDKMLSDTKYAGNQIDGEKTGEPVSAKIKQMAQQQQHQQPAGGTILAQSEISSSQLDFFKMLDEKIENGPDYAEDEEEEKARLATLLEEWKAASLARELKKKEPVQEQEKWSSSPSRNVTYADDYVTYPLRGTSSVDTQRFPTGYSSCPPSTTIGIHLQNTFRASIFAEKTRIQSRTPYHPYQLPAEPLNHCEDGHPLSSAEPPNPLRTGYQHLSLKHPTVNTHHFPENQRLFPAQYPDSTRTYVEPRSFALPRVIPSVNVLHEQRSYIQEGRPFSERVYQDARQNFLIGYQADLQRSDVARLLPDGQRIFHERVLEGQRSQIAFQRPPLMAQRSFQEPSRIYRDLETAESFPRKDRFELEGSSSRASSFKIGRSASVDIQYGTRPTPPRETVPLQGAPGPPQGSPRPLAARALQMGTHRLPTSTVVQFRKSRGTFSESA